MDIQREQSERIARLAGIVHDKREIVQGMAMQNIYGLEPEVRRKQAIAFEIARAELWQAEANLRDAMRPSWPHNMVGARS